jgi:23S rRNA (uracil1939-C5)-methyltransferase
MSSHHFINFKISSIDSLGQGVCKETDKITFIPKTAPGDEGCAEIVSEKKGVAFAQLKTLTKFSPLRIDPICPHFSQCPSCHFLHLPYPEELASKKVNLERLFSKLKIPPVQVLGAPRRLGYRNRIQLHYDLDRKLLGMLDAKRNLIVPVPLCSIGEAHITNELKRLYQEDSWLTLAPRTPRRGHVELYSHKNELKVNWNRPYAEGGFTQVFAEMNQLLKGELSPWMQQLAPAGILDLFGGDGNLTEVMKSSARLCVDAYPHSPGLGFFSQDLYHPSALPKVKAKLKELQLTPSLLVLDPPRSGLKDLKLWTDTLKPDFLAYVSCDAHTLVRDLAGLVDYSIDRIFLVDFFPSTFHFETMIFASRKS